MLIEPIWIALGGGLALAGGIALLVRAQERKRREAYQEFCLVRGFRFDERRPDAHKPYEDLFDLFNAGRSRAWGYTISGTKNGAPFTAFEYKWVTSGGKNSHTNHLHAILWESDGASLPRFALTPEGLLSRLGQLFGMQDIDFDDAPEFSRLYRLRGDDEAGVRGLFTAELRAFFGVTPGQRLSGRGRSLFWWRSGRLPRPDRLDEWLEEGDRIRRRFFKE